MTRLVFVLNVVIIMDYSIPHNFSNENLNVHLSSFKIQLNNLINIYCSLNNPDKLIAKKLIYTAFALIKDDTIESSQLFPLIIGSAPKANNVPEPLSYDSDSTFCRGKTLTQLKAVETPSGADSTAVASTPLDCRIPNLDDICLDPVGKSLTDENEELILNLCSKEKLKDSSPSSSSIKKNSTKNNAPDIPDSYNGSYNINSGELVKNSEKMLADTPVLNLAQNTRLLQNEDAHLMNSNNTNKTSINPNTYRCSAKENDIDGSCSNNFTNEIAMKNIYDNTSSASTDDETISRNKSLTYTIAPVSEDKHKQTFSRSNVVNLATNNANKEINMSNLTPDVDVNKADSVETDLCGVNDDSEKTSMASYERCMSCIKCRNEFCSLSLFENHIQTCVGPKQCHYCNQKFYIQESYSKHMSLHQRNSCPECNNSFVNHKQLKMHMKDIHGLTHFEKVYKCIYCQKHFTKKASLYNHYKMHNPQEQIICLKCGKFCKDEADHEKHMLEHSKLRCEICNAVFGRRQQYEDHLKGHRNNSCEYCEMSFSTKKALFKHCRVEHQTVISNLFRKHECKQCHKTFSRPSVLKQHLVVHSGIKVKGCGLCNKSFAHEKSLRKHLRSTIHQQMVLCSQSSEEVKDEKTKSAATSPICKVCNLRFPSVRMLSLHCKTFHDASVTHACPQCDYKTDKRQHFKRHLESHSGIRKFICEICGSGFNTLMSLKEHNIFVHSDERNFVCTICPKTFKNKSTLVRHMRSHSAERPYKCKCGNCYKRLSNLKRHISTPCCIAMGDTKVSPPEAHKTSSKRGSESKNNNSESLSISTDLFEPQEKQLQDSLSGLGKEGSFQDPLLPPSRDTSDLLLSSHDILIGGDAEAVEQNHYLTVLDPQFIQLIPSAFHVGAQDAPPGLHTVSLINAGEIHTIATSGGPYSTLSHSAPPFTTLNQGTSVLLDNFAMANDSAKEIVVTSTPQSGDDSQVTHHNNQIPNTTLGEAVVLVDSTSGTETLVEKDAPLRNKDKGQVLEIPSLEDSDMTLPHASFQGLDYEVEVDVPSMAFTPTNYLSSMSQQTQEIMQNNMHIF